jgi:hypothetical protein
MAAPAAATLTGAGYTLTNGVYTKTFGSIVVNFTLYENGNGTLAILPSGDVSAADIASVQASLSAVGINTINNINTTLGVGVTQAVSVSAAGGLQSFGMSL